MSDLDTPFDHPWSQEAIGSIGNVTVGGTPRTSVKEYWDGDVPWMASGDVHLKRITDVPIRITKSGLRFSNATLVEPPAVAISLAGQGKTRGTVALVLCPLCTNQSVALIKGSPTRVVTDYLFYNLEFRYEELRSRSAGEGRAGLSKRILEQVPVPLPPLSDQTRIAEILSTVDRAIEQIKALIAKQQCIKTGLIQDLLTRGIDEHGNLRSEQTHQFKDSPLGQIPVEWAVYPCREVTELITVGIVIRPAQYYVASGIPALRSANICEDGINTVDLVFISSRSNDQLAKSQLRSGDVVTVRTGYPGTSAVVPTELSGSNCIDVLISRPSEGLRSEFLATWINSPFGKNQVLRKQGGLAQQHFNVGELRDLIIPLPSLEEQDAIISVLSASEARVAEESYLARKCHTIKQGLMQDLLTGKRCVTKL